MEYSSLDSLKMVERRECDPRDSLHPLTVRGASARAQIRAHSTQTHTHTHEEIDAPLSRPGVLRWAVRFRRASASTATRRAPTEFKRDAYTLSRVGNMSEARVS